MRVRRMIAFLGALATSAVCTADQSLPRLVSSNMRSHFLSPEHLNTSVAFACDGSRGRYVWEQSSDGATGYFRVELVRIENDERPLSAAALAKVNAMLAGPAMLRSSFVSCSGDYLTIQLDLHRMTSKPTMPVTTENVSYAVELKGAELLSVDRLGD